MHNLSLVKANLDELASLAAVLPPDVLDAEQMQEWITMAVKTCMHQNGGDKFLITCGSKGVYLYQSKLDGKTLPEQRSVTLPDKSAMKIIPVTDIEELHVTHYEFAPVDDIVDSTGAGDSLLGTTAWAHIEAQLPLEWAVVVGIAAARLTLRFTQAVAPDINNKTFKPLVDIY
jgi:sugar/nucleoside kinase (ribokinase family)